MPPGNGASGRFEPYHRHRAGVRVPGVVVRAWLHSPLPGYDQNIAAAGAAADRISWAAHVEDFRAVRTATITFFRNLPADAWERSGIASDNPFTVRALAYIIPGHVAHHVRILRERYW